MIHTVKDFGIVNRAEINVFLELSCFFHDPADVGNLISSLRRYKILKALLIKAQVKKDTGVILLKIHMQTGYTGLELENFLLSLSYFPRLSCFLLQE